MIQEIYDMSVAARALQGESWGPFSIAPVYKKDVHVGWGATCGMHLDAGNMLECKRQLTLGENSDAECVSKLKEWLLNGAPIEAAATDARFYLIICYYVFTVIVAFLW
jgi:hypothetical protein